MDKTYTIEITVVVDQDHPGIDSTGDATEALEDFIRAAVHEDDYMGLDDISVTEERN